MTPSPLASGKTYWLAVLSDDGTLRYRSPYRRSCLSNTSLRAHLHRLPGLWRLGTARARTHCPISAYLLAAGSSLSLSPLVSGSPLPRRLHRFSRPRAKLRRREPPASTLPPTNTQLPEETPPPPFEETPPPPSEETPPPPSEETPPPPSEEPPPPPASPANIVPPAIGGSPVEDQTLKASTGKWTGHPTSYAYQWKICNTAGVACSNLSEATSSSYKLVSSDVRHELRVAVTASNASGHNEANSPATAEVTAETPPPPPPAPTNTVLPTISGEHVEGETLKAGTGTWTGNPTSYTYQWEDCYALGMGCLSISGATASSYKLTASDVESTIRVVVTASNADGHNEATSAATGTVEPAGPEEHGGAGDRRVGCRRRNAAGKHRNVVGRSHLLRVSVGVLQSLGRQELHGNRRRDDRHARADFERCGAHDPGRGEGDQRRRLRRSHLRSDERRDGAIGHAHGLLRGS